MKRVLTNINYALHDKTDTATRYPKPLIARTPRLKEEATDPDFNVEVLKEKVIMSLGKLEFWKAGEFDIEEVPGPTQSRDVFPKQDPVPDLVVASETEPEVESVGKWERPVETFKLYGAVEIGPTENCFPNPEEETIPLYNAWVVAQNIITGEEFSTFCVKTSDLPPAALYEFPELPRGVFIIEQ